jgi:hypothetical protein
MVRIEIRSENKIAAGGSTGGCADQVYAVRTIAPPQMFLPASTIAFDSGDVATRTGHILSYETAMLRSRADLGITREPSSVPV